MVSSAILITDVCHTWLRFPTGNNVTGLCTRGEEKSQGAVVCLFHKAFKAVACNQPYGRFCKQSTMRDAFKKKFGLHGRPSAQSSAHLAVDGYSHPPRHAVTAAAAHRTVPLTPGLLWWQPVMGEACCGR